MPRAQTRRYLRTFYSGAAILALSFMLAVALWGAGF